MTYQEIKTALRSFQEQGHVIPALNSKKEVLEAALLQLQTMTAAEDSPAMVVEVAIEAEPTPAAAVPTETLETLPTQEPTDLAITPSARLISISPEHPAITELRELAKGIEVVLIWGIALVRSMIRFSTPYLVRAAHKALRWAVYGAVAFRIFILPKLLIVAYSLGIWGVSIALRIVRGRRGVAIA